MPPSGTVWISTSCLPCLLQALVATNDSVDAFSLLQNMAPMSYDSSRLIDVACIAFAGVSDKQLAVLRQAHRQTVIAQFAVRTTLPLMGLSALAAVIGRRSWPPSPAFAVVMQPHHRARFRAQRGQSLVQALVNGVIRHGSQASALLMWWLYCLASGSPAHLSTLTPMEADRPSPEWLSLSPHWTAAHPAMQEAPYDEEGWVSSGDEARDGTLVPGKHNPFQALPPRLPSAAEQAANFCHVCSEHHHLPILYGICGAFHASSCSKLLPFDHKASCF